MYKKVEVIRVKAFLPLLVWVLSVWASGQLVAIAPTVDRSGSGLLNLEYGISETLERKLREAGYEVLPARALESWREGQGIPVRNEAIWKAAAQALGASHLILLTLESLTTARLSLVLGPLVLEAVSAGATLSAMVWEVPEGREVGRISGTGSGQGTLVPSFRFFLAIPWDVCLGGLRTNKSVYLQGEPVLIGYRDPAPPRNFHVEVRSLVDPALVWISAMLSSSPDHPCVTWTWDQMFGVRPAPAGSYQVMLYYHAPNQPQPIVIATTTFVIEPGFPAWGLELKFGAPEFHGTAWQQAISAAIEDLWDKLLPLLPRSRP